MLAHHEGSLHEGSLNTGAFLPGTGAALPGTGTVLDEHFEEAHMIGENPEYGVHKKKGLGTKLKELFTGKHHHDTHDVTGTHTY